MLLAAAPYTCSKTAVCWNLLESFMSNIAFSELALLRGTGQCIKMHLFFGNSGSSTSFETHKSQKSWRVQHMEKSRLYISGIYLLSYSALASEWNLNSHNSFPIAFSFFWSLKSNIAVKSVGLQQERKAFFLRT